MPKSKAEARLAFAVASGSASPKSTGMSRDYAKEVVGEMHKRGPGAMKALPAHAGAKSRKGSANSLTISLVASLAFIILLGALQLIEHVALAQGPNQGAPTRINYFPSKRPSTHNFYTGTNLTYSCYANPDAPSNGVSHSWTVAATTLTSIVVATNVGTVTTATAHGLIIGEKVVVTGSATGALNATYYIQTTPSSTTFTITTSGVGDGTYNDSTLVLTTDAPVEIDPKWSIAFYQYDGSNNLLSQTWASGDAGAYNLICANRAVKTGATAIFYK